MKETTVKFKDVTDQSPKSHLKPNGKGSLIVAHSGGPVVDRKHVRKYKDLNDMDRYQVLYFFLIDRGTGDEWLAELHDLSEDGRDDRHIKTFQLVYSNGQFDFEANDIMKDFVESTTKILTNGRCAIGRDVG